MNKISNYLWKFFSLIMVFTWNTSTNVVLADESGEETPAQKERRLLGNLYYSNAHVSDAPIKNSLCPSGKYVYSCNGIKVGYNWLKNYTFIYDKVDTYKNTTNDAGEIIKKELDKTTYKEHETGNYFVGNTDYERANQLRAFFSNKGEGGMMNKSVEQTSTDQGGTTTIIEKVSPDSFDVKMDKELMLALLCNPTKSAVIYCADCPDSAAVNESYVYADEYDGDMLLIHDSWKFNTIADCYLNKFEDDTGEYIFVQDSTLFASETNGTQCYYTNDEYMSGDDIVYSAASAQNVVNQHTISPDYSSSKNQTRRYY